LIVSTNLQSSLAIGKTSIPLQVKLEVGQRSYLIVLPHAGTDYVQKKLATECVPYEQEMLEDICNRVSSDALVLDIGANIGNHTLYLAAVAGCRVESFEPNLELCAALRESIALNGFGDRVRLHETGLGRAAGKARFRESKPENLGSQCLDLGEGDLSVCLLDSFRFERKVEVIKLDVEGMEIDVLDGASQLLQRDRPLIYVECATEAHFRRMSRWMSAVGYTYWDTFNATPTHLFIPSERLSVEQRLQHLQAKSAQGDYKSNQLLREIRARMSQALEKEREARTALANAQAQERATRAALAKAQALERETRAALADAQAQERQERMEFADEKNRLVQEVAGLRHQLDQSRRSVQDLSRAVEVRELKLAATKKRAIAFAERLEITRESASFQIGQALIAAGRSVNGALRLPLELARIYRGASSRRIEDASETGKTMHGAKREKVVSTKAHADEAVVMPLAALDPARLPGVPAVLKSLRVAGIMDEFTHHSFASECALLPLRLANWQADIEAFKPDMVFVESAWRGAEGDWSLKISNPSEELASLIAWAQARHVPTVFWNKEDPVHFDGFLHVARAVDYVFTTDIDCIARYKREVGHDRVYLLPFAAQPASHNPIERFPRADAFCFAGSYYLKYPERQRDFRSLLDVMKEIKPIEIFDRNFDKPHPHYEFPPEYQPYIKGSLPFDQIDKAYKGYRYGVNMNTIKQSQTMFARRVFELLASNTVVVSNFSRGMRLLFGDLVIASDASAEIRRRLEPLEDETTLRKFRLAGLRKVMSQHTYAIRLAYIAEKLGALAAPPASAALCAVAFPTDADQAHALVAGWRRQSLAGAHLCLIGADIPTGLLDEDVSQAATAEDLCNNPAYLHAGWVAPLTATDYHGPHYLFDLLQATGYCDATAIGKASHYRSTSGAGSGVELVDGDRVYRPAEALPARCSILSRERFEALRIVDSAGLEAAVVTGEGLMAIDEFNYALGVSEDAAPAVRQQVDDLPELRGGLDLRSELLANAERIAPASAAEARSKDDVDGMPGLSAEDMAAMLPPNLGAQLSDGALVVNVQVPPGKHRYAYLERNFERAELNLETNSRVHLLCEHEDTMEVRTVFEYMDANGQKISHTIAKAGQAHSLAIPAACRSVRFGLRFVGYGELRIRRLLTADMRERPTVLVSTARHLVVLKQYPDYDDLYRYGFVHSRLRAYAKEHLRCDVLRLATEEPCGFREFEDIDVMTGDWDFLDLALRGGGYEHVLVHLMDKTMWEVIQRHIDRVRVTVWLHGAEIQAWQRRAFEFDGLEQAEITRRKRLSEQRLEFWRELLAAPHPNLHFVFVSKQFASEVAEDLSIDLSEVPHSVIHNFVDPEVFPYRPKAEEDRFHILAIRPFSSRKYANDLLVKVVQDLARDPLFAQLSFTIVGDGEEFRDARDALGGFANVRLEQRFLTQREIAALHARHGIFLSPTRWDSQGVSRDEAMSSGLVPISHAVSAVPEFVDQSCGLLVPADSVHEMAAAVSALVADPARFLTLSASAARRAQSQSGLAATVLRELELIDGRPGAATHGSDECPAPASICRPQVRNHISVPNGVATKATGPRVAEADRTLTDFDPK
jgi:FkbM family methyltransferase